MIPGQVLALCKQYFEGIHVDVNSNIVVQKVQKAIFNFKNASGVLLEMLSTCVVNNS
jgi:hypothetical protein